MYYTRVRQFFPKTCLLKCSNVPSTHIAAGILATIEIIHKHPLLSTLPHGPFGIHPQPGANGLRHHPEPLPKLIHETQRFLPVRHLRPRQKQVGHQGRFVPLRQQGLSGETPLPPVRVGKEGPGDAGPYAPREAGAEDGRMGGIEDDAVSLLPRGDGGDGPRQRPLLSGRGRGGGFPFGGDGEPGIFFFDGEDPERGHQLGHGTGEIGVGDLAEAGGGEGGQFDAGVDVFGAPGGGRGQDGDFFSRAGQVHRGVDAGFVAADDEVGDVFGGG
mmetsp:Transcript_30832/g.70540  ORF Transcript_30832/g.70540 Transcript_30832/m.70540 type:complete len:272 (-) Transcript_30832:662-1477(-)